MGGFKETSVQRLTPSDSHAYDEKAGEKQPATPAPSGVMSSAFPESRTSTITGSISSRVGPAGGRGDESKEIREPSLIPPPPDGGLRAWLQVVAGHLAVFNSWGYINSFGIFQGTYTSLLGLPASSISWIGSVQVFLIFFVGAFSGRAMDAGHYQKVLWAGTVLQLVGVFATSWAGPNGSYWQVFLAQGLCQGLGGGLFFCPTIALVSTYFARRRTAAIAIVAAGSSTGGIVFPLIAQNLLPRIGFAWTIRVMGFVILFNSVFIVAAARTRLRPRKSGPFLELAAFREIPYTLFTIGSFFTLWAVYFGYYYARVYALDRLSSSNAASFSILLVLNAVGLPGRVVPGLIADRFSPRSPIFVLIPCVMAAALLLYLWTTVHSLTGYFVWIAFFGWFGGSIQGLFPGTIASLSADPSKNGTRIGMVFSIVSVACLTGPPLAGKLVQVDGGSYLGAQVWGGTSLLVGSAFSSAAAVALFRRFKREEAEKN